MLTSWPPGNQAYETHTLGIFHIDTTEIFPALDWAHLRVLRTATGRRPLRTTNGTRENLPPRAAIKPEVAQISIINAPCLWKTANRIVNTRNRRMSLSNTDAFARVYQSKNEYVSRDEDVTRVLYSIILN